MGEGMGRGKERNSGSGVPGKAEEPLPEGARDRQRRHRGLRSSRTGGGHRGYRGRGQGTGGGDRAVLRPALPARSGAAHKSPARASPAAVGSAAPAAPRARGGTGGVRNRAGIRILNRGIRILSRVTCIPNRAGIRIPNRGIRIPNRHCRFREEPHSEPAASRTD